ncbi:phenylalanine--tRNA ligase subunit alpha [Mycoplasmatota bacterium]|nr:phenylalanine--tRNA ligase subunit alpha [Mycoplasmatota bacterium]
MNEKLKQIGEEAKKTISIVDTIHDLNNEKARYLGKKGLMAEFMKMMKDATIEEKKEIGKASNEVKQLITKLLDERKEYIENKKVEEKLASESLDVTLPGKISNVGVRHILNQVTEELEDLFIGMGYIIQEGPEIEIDEFNFEKLNLPKDHPARDMQDSFYISDELLLRTHTSPVQVRTMLEYGGKEAIKIVCPGKVYRRDDDDATHSHQFMQFEALVVDKMTTLSDLKGTLLEFAKKLFGDDRSIRLRPSYFPFTEPSMEVDVSCSKCGGSGCNMCKGTGWIEVLGAGMVNNNVLELCGYDSKIYQGFALGMGVERIAMLKYGIDDIRHFYTNDLRFLKQFK